SHTRTATFGASPRVSCGTSMSGFTAHDSAHPDRDWIVGCAFRLICCGAAGDARWRIAAFSLERAAAYGTHRHRVNSDGGQLRPLRAVLRCAAGLHLRTGAYGRRQVRPGGGAVSGHEPLGDPASLVHGEAAALLNLLNSRGEEARVIGGAVRN